MTVNYPNDDDGRAITSIAATGMDLSKPTKIEFAIASPDKSASEAMKMILAKGGYDSEVYYDEGEPDFQEGEESGFGPSWTVYVMLNLVPSYENVVQVQKKLGDLVEKLGGKVDGWEIKLAR